MKRFPIHPLVLTMGFFLGGCGGTDDAGARDFMVTDSAGIQVVSNSAAGAMR